MGKTTRLGWTKLRRELDAASIATRPASQQGCADTIIAR
jgi:hypothetical protein